MWLLRVSFVRTSQFRLALSAAPYATLRRRRRRTLIFSHFPLYTKKKAHSSPLFFPGRPPPPLFPSRELSLHSLSLFLSPRPHHATVLRGGGLFSGTGTVFFFFLGWICQLLYYYGYSKAEEDLSSSSSSSSSGLRVPALSRPYNLSRKRGRGADPAAWVVVTSFLLSRRRKGGKGGREYCLADRRGGLKNMSITRRKSKQELNATLCHI